MKSLTLFRLVSLLVCLWLFPSTGGTIPLSNSSNQHNFSNAADDTNNNTIPPHLHPHADDPSDEGTAEIAGTTEICIFCHTPHGASPQSSLWNRPDPASMKSFPVYDGALVIKGSFNVADATLHSQYNTALFRYPNGASKLCLSCHDGITAIGTVLDGTAFQMLNASNINAMGDPRLVINLKTSHPISFVYDDQVLKDIDKVKTDQYQLPTLVDVPLDGQQRMQCTTCHDPHEDTRADVGLPFWRHRTNEMPEAFTDVCNDCHISVGGMAGKLGDLHDKL